ncbi:MAG: efflux RND transporter periplasmic adaptor subunit [Bacteroidales bacterium]|nr:efflux RND transporter periplasmic adaptor subunit [Bacteroidales bacterium]MCF8327466.1 efflux RND transporter periplasmic adaptor subunit [Bacteroidales bacterium]
MKTNNIKKYGIFTLLFVLGLVAGALIWSGGDGSSKEKQATDEHEHAESEDTEYTCSMHPSVRQDEPGDCPICGMELIPVEDESSEGTDVQDFEMTETAMKLAQVRTSEVTAGSRAKEITLEGKIAADQRKVYSQVVHFGGRLEALNVSYVGQKVEKGQKLGSIYSPDLVAAQRELLETSKFKYGSQEMLEAARQKLKQWKLSDEQIEDIIQSGEVKTNFDIRADVSGYVTKMKANKGDYLHQGDYLFEIADLSSVWVMLDAYERDLQWLHEGQEVKLKVNAFPGREFSGTINFIDPFIDENSRVAQVRAELNNSNRKLKPGMFIKGRVKATMKEGSDALLIPKTAVLWTGERSLVYVQNQEAGEKHLFRMREITTGQTLEDSIIVLDGLEQGERVVSHGTFAVDAAAQLAGKTSMMNPETETASAADLVKEGETAGVQEKDKITDVEKFEVSTEFQQQLTRFYRDYIKMKNSFVDTDPDKVNEHANQLQNSLENIDMSLLEGEAHMQWMDYLKILKKDLNTIAGSSDIEVQREAFVTFNPAFYKAVKAFGLIDVKAYYQFCPMANDDKGAYWISEQKEIRNPYFGDEMMSCGENKDTIGG